MTEQLGIRELAEKAMQEGALDLAQGVIDAPPPPELVTILQQLPIERISSYNNKRGVLQYRKAIVNYLSKRNWAVAIDTIMGTTGVMAGISSALLSDCRPGDTVLLPEPFFVYHKLLLEVLGFNIEFFLTPLDNQPDWDEIMKKMSESEAAIITTPANPTGQIAPPEVIQDLSQAAHKKNCLLILDEIYREHNWSEKTPDDSTYKKVDLNNTVITRSFSKTFAIPGWRVGFAVTSPKRIENMAVSHDSLYIGGSTIAQNAIAQALENHYEELSHYVQNLRSMLMRNRDLLAQAFADYGMEPVLPVPGAYYMMIKHHRDSDTAAAEELLNKKIVVTPANILYSNPQKNTSYIRIHFAVSEETADAVVKILKK